MDINLTNTKDVMTYIDTLIERAGGQIENFWPYIIKQMYVEFFIALSCFIIFLLVASISLWLNSYWDNKETYNNSKAETAKTLAVVAGVCILFSGLFVLSYMPQMINPEFYAVQKLMELIP